MSDLLETFNRWLTAVLVMLPMLATTAHGQSVNDAIRQQRESRSVLEIQGAKLRLRGQTQAQIAARAKADAEAAQVRQESSGGPGCSESSDGAQSGWQGCVEVMARGFSSVRCRAK
jgi:hypothetical protein